MNIESAGASLASINIFSCGFGYVRRAYKMGALHSVLLWLLEMQHLVARVLAVHASERPNIGHWAKEFSNLVLFCHWNKEIMHHLTRLALLWMTLLTRLDYSVYNVQIKVNSRFFYSYSQIYKLYFKFATAQSGDGVPNKISGMPSTSDGVLEISLSAALVTVHPVLVGLYSNIKMGHY